MKYFSAHKRVCLVALGLGMAAGPAVSQVPQRPAGVTDQQLRQAIQQRGLGDQLRQRLQQSGLTPDQIRARLRAAGYSEDLIDQYLVPASPGQAAPPPNSEMLRAMAALGFHDLALATDTTDALGVLLTRDDSLLLDSLELRIGVDSIPLKVDSLGQRVLDVDSARAIAHRLRAPRLFGYDVFRRASTQFAPVLAGPVDAGYRLGPGDELVLILTGDNEFGHQLPVTREGFVVIPQVGQVQVANLTMAQLREVLYTRLGQVYSGVRRGAGARTRFEVSVSRVRVNQVFVTGDVARPGSYTVSALGTVTHALYMAGGPTERGNFRDVRVLRSGEVTATVDLYRYLTEGNTRDDVRLEQGDVVFVPPRGPRITLQGEVVRPAIYELRPGEGLRDLLRMAGGLLPSAATNRAYVERTLPPAERLPGRDRTALDVDIGAILAGGPDFPLAGDDAVRIFPVNQPLRNRVTIRGNVWRPGSFSVAPGTRLSSVLREAGGVKEDTYLGRAHILRLLPDSSRRLLPVSLGGGQERSDDPELQEFDEITVYSVTGFRPSRQVAVYGRVQRPGLYPYRDSMTVRDLVMMAGGLRDDAYLLEAEVARVAVSDDGGTVATIRRLALDSSFILDLTSPLPRRAGVRADDPTLEPFDNVYVRRLPGFDVLRNVVVSGEVRFPGRYALTRRDERLLDILNRAGGVTEFGHVRGVQFHRAEGRAGRVGIDLERVLRDPTFRDNFILFAGDSIHVPEYQAVVVVEGSVNSPVAVAWVPGRDASYFVDRAGGYARRADQRRTYIVQPNGTVERRGSRVQPGARVVVPERPSDDQSTNWTAILTITSSLVTSLLSIIVISRQL
jgi:polysaccharide export outer membrane protein